MAWFLQGFSFLNQKLEIESMAGAPEGNNNAAKGAQWRNAIERIVNHWPEPPEKWAAQQNMGIHKMAFLFVSKMVDAQDIAFFKEFGDRLDGKPKQQLEIDANVTNHEAALEQLK